MQPKQRKCSLRLSAQVTLQLPELRNGNHRIPSRLPLLLLPLQPAADVFLDRIVNFES
jgi:hypothetical protein